MSWNAWGYGRHSGRVSLLHLTAVAVTDTGGRVLLQSLLGMFQSRVPRREDSTRVRTMLASSRSACSQSNVWQCTQQCITRTGVRTMLASTWSAGNTQHMVWQKNKIDGVWQCTQQYSKVKLRDGDTTNTVVSAAGTGTAWAYQALVFRCIINDQGNTGGRTSDASGTGSGTKASVHQE